VITVVHMRGFAQQGDLCSLDSKIYCSMFSVPQPELKSTRTSSFSEQNSHQHTIILSGDKPVPSTAELLDGEETGGEAGDDTPHGYGMYPIRHCCTAWTKSREDPTTPLGQFTQALAGRAGLPLSRRLFCRVSSEDLVV